MFAVLPRRLRLASLALITCASLQARTWTDTQGRTLDAELVSATATEIKVLRTDGRTVTLGIAQLSAADRAFLTQKSASAAPAAQSVPSADFNELNTLLGLPLLADESLWDDVPAEVARRLKLNVEGKNEHFEGYRAYPHPARVLLGADALMISLQAAEGHPSTLTIQFANSGDFPGFRHCESDHDKPTTAELSAFEKTLKHDFAAITTSLTAKLGEPKRERALFGGLDSGRLSLCWEWHGHTLRLSQDPGQMVLLKIVPAERTGSSRLGRDQLIRLFKERVAHRPGGDVILDQIPMVDQGPKGYCVPATFERYLRYAGIPADMYELAACGGNTFGGGTSFEEMAHGLANYVSRQGRGLEKASFKLSVAGISRYIDEGRPIIWGLYSSQAYNAVASANTGARKRAADLTTWKPISTRSEIDAIYADPSAAHACLIIGYNRTTNEIAVSDSWGPQFQERWIPVAAAQKASQGEYWLLSW